MTGTMNKSDIQYECDELAEVDWQEVRRLVGKSVPPLAEKEVKEAIKKQEAGKLKAPYLKVGLVDGDLVLRIKDGSKHISDVILVEAENVGRQSDVVELSGPEQKQVDDYRRAKETLPERTKEFLQQFREQLKQVDDLAGEIKDRSGAVVFSPVTNAHEVGEIATCRGRIEAIYDDLERILRAEVKEALMDPHRNGTFAKCPACAQGDLRAELLSIASKCWTAANNHYGQMEGIVKQCQSSLAIARQLESKAVKVCSGASTARDAELETLQGITTQLESDLRGVLNLFNAANSAGHFVEFVGNKTRDAEKENATLESRHLLLNQVINQAKLIAGRSKDVHGKFDEIHNQAVSAVSHLDKQLAKDEEFKPLLKKIVEINKQVELKRKEWDHDVTTALKGFEKMKKLVAT